MPSWSVLLASLLTVVTATQPSRQVTSIEWDRSTLRLVAENAHYGRIIVMRDGDWLAGFSRGGHVWSSRSTDAGKTWEPAVRVGGYVKGIATNSELLQLADGRVMYLFNERERNQAAEGEEKEPDNGIAIVFSDDFGKTWSPSTRIYGGGPMWEPVAFERGQQLQIFFADEKPYPNTNEQQISLMESRDVGKTWRGPTSVSFRRGHRDGMPVPVRLGDDRVGMAIEDDGLSGTFKPVILNLSGNDPWPIDGSSRYRRSALAEPLPAEVYAGAPYIVRLGEKATVLSAQVAEPGKPRQMAVWIGDEEAKHFAGRTSPFEMAGDAEQLWNALLELDDDRVLAITGTKIKGKTGIWTIEGRLAR